MLQLFYQKGLTTLQTCVSELVDYMDFLQINHEYSFRMLSMYASAISSILWPTEQTRTSAVSIVQQLLKGLFRMNPPTMVWTESWVFKKVIDLLHPLGKPAVLNYLQVESQDGDDSVLSHGQETI